MTTSPPPAPTDRDEQGNKYCKGYPQLGWPAHWASPGTFGPHTSARDGLAYRCRPCRAAWIAARRAGKVTPRAPRELPTAALPTTATPTELLRQAALQLQQTAALLNRTAALLEATTPPPPPPAPEPPTGPVQLPGMPLQHLGRPFIPEAARH